ncbi:MAG: RluA family pseudouridine synthase [Planctomycetia bacterium]|nr:RluA family pseudouridine synthase [Planctomycetia bacterium]
MPDDDLLLTDDAELEELEAPEEPKLVFAPRPVHEVLVPGVRQQVYGRLDHYLVDTFPGHSRSAFQEAIDQKLALVNGKPVKASYKVRAGDAIQVTLPTTPHLLPQPENIPLDIILEDEYLAVINKPANMVVHPAKGNWSGTLVNALRYHFQHLSGINGDYRPGIVHRLDRDTTGAILIAKEEKTHRMLGMQFEERKVYKEYHALCQGVLARDSDYVEKAIGHDPRDRTKMAVFNYVDEAKDIKPACTFYEVIERYDGYCYVKAYPKTGRTHQIRVHLAHLGCPILADKAYSGQSQFKLSQLNHKLSPEDDSILLHRQALHAHLLRFQHPIKGHWVEAVAPLPEEMMHTRQLLKEHRPLGKIRR